MSQTNDKRWSDVHKDLVQDMTLMDDKFMHEVFMIANVSKQSCGRSLMIRPLKSPISGHRKNWITSLAKAHRWMSLPRAGLLFSTT